METGGQDRQTIRYTALGGLEGYSGLVEGVGHRVRHIALFSFVLHGSVGVAFEI